MRSRMGPMVLLSIALVAAGGCGYPRRSTPLSEVTGAVRGGRPPADLWQLTILEAYVQPRRKGGLAWDQGEGQPDPFVRLYRGERQVWQSDAVEDTLHPQFNVTLPRNVWLPSDRRIRFELWDRDQVTSDPIGQWRGQGLPDNVVPGAVARISFRSGATLVLRIDPPKPHRGTGIARYEVRPEALRVLEVIEHSPAARAGLRRGDDIVAIGDTAISELGEARAVSQLSMAGRRTGAALSVLRDGARQQVELDGGYVWLAM